MNRRTFSGIFFFVMLAGSFLPPSLARASDEDEVFPLERYGTEAEPLRFPFQLDYVQSSGFWSSYNALTGAEGSPLALASALESRYGQNQEVFARASLGVSGISFDDMPDLARQLYVRVGAEATCWGLTENPIVSELHADLVEMASVSVGMTGVIPGSPIRTKMGLVVGSGTEKSVDLISPDLVGEVTINLGMVRMYGLDLGLSVSSDAKEGFIAGTSLDDHPTLFSTDLEGAVWANRWKSFSFLEFSGGENHSGPFFRPHFILGPQPLPVDLLPRTWDLVHRLGVPPSFGAWSGEGVEFGFLTDHGAGFKATAGYYGEFWGGSIAYDSGAFEIKAQSWGISVGDDVVADSERLWGGSIGFSF